MRPTLSTLNVYPFSRLLSAVIVVLTRLRLAAARRRQSSPPPSFRTPLVRARPANIRSPPIPSCSTFLLLFSLLVISRILPQPQHSTRSEQPIPESSKAKLEPTSSFRLRIPFIPLSQSRGAVYEDLDWGDDDDGHYAAQLQIPSKPVSPITTHEYRPLKSTFTASTSHGGRLHHKYRSDGLMEFVANGPHPVSELIRISERRWKEKLNRSSRTLREAVEEYRRRYHRMPPTGFDKWWRYIVRHNVQLPDEYDQIFHDLEPFWGMSPAFIQEQQGMWEKDDEVGSYTLVNEDHQVFLAGHTMKPEEEDIAIDRGAEQLRLLEEIQQWLPDFRATFTAHDVPYQFIGYDMRSEAVDHASMSEYVDAGDGVDFENRHPGWSYACPETSPLRQSNLTEDFSGSHIWEAPKTFIHDHKLSMDPCQHASHVHLNGFLSSHGEGPVPRKKMVPAFSMCSTQLHSDILAVAMEMWTEDVGKDPEWKDKLHNKLLWRGRNTGTFFGEDGKWRDSQRVRLVRTTNEVDGYVYILNSTAGSADVVSMPEAVSIGLLNEELMDVGFSGEAIQCERKICEEVENTLTYKGTTTFEEANNWKYVMDVDGNGWSARFKRLMTSNSLIFKSTIFPEWYSDRIQPWVHYIPIKNDFTDLYDVLTFFHGDVSGNNSHDDLAEMIARQGKEWSLAFWRKEDMTAYMFRLFLEYARVMSRDRDAATFKWEDVRTGS